MGEIEFSKINSCIEDNTIQLKNCFENVNDELVEKRLSDETNSMIHLLFHLVESRYYLLNFTGEKVESPFLQFGDSSTNINNIENYPGKDKLLKEWEKISTMLKDCMNNLSKEFLENNSSVNFPISDNTNLGAILFIIQHEAFHIGQLAFLRKLHGLPAMKYK